jgi:hypothetical protein
VFIFSYLGLKIEGELFEICIAFANPT